MKHYFLRTATLAVACLILFSAFKHNSAPYLVVSCGPDGQIGQLEPAVGTLQKAKGKSASSTYIIDGVSSTRRFKLSEICFQIQTSTGQPDPFMYVNLYKLSTGKTNRTLTINNDGSYNASMIPMQIPLLEANKYKVIIGGAITAGEYAFVDKSMAVTDGKISVWAFGIDQ